MKKNQTAQRILTPGQMKDISSAIVEAIPSNLPFNLAEWCVGHKGELSKKVRKIFTSMMVNPYAEIVLEWEQFYLKHFQQTYNFSQLMIVDCPGEKWRLLIIVDLLLEQLYAKMKGLFPCWRWTNDDLDKIVTWNERDAKNGPYAIWVRDEIEADEKYKNLSANKIKEMKVTTETLAERFIHELKFFTETQGHLDIKNITLCAGSRFRDVSVPRVYFYPFAGRVSVDWTNSDHAYDFLRSRRAVSA